MAKQLSELRDGMSPAPRARAGQPARPPAKGGILAALRRSPLVGAELDLERSRESSRSVDL